MYTSRCKCHQKYGQNLWTCWYNHSVTITLYQGLDITGWQDTLICFEDASWHILVQKINRSWDQPLACNQQESRHLNLRAPKKWILPITWINSEWILFQTREYSTYLYSILNRASIDVTMGLWLTENVNNTFCFKPLNYEVSCYTALEISWSAFPVFHYLLLLNWYYTDLYICFGITIYKMT